MAQGPVPRGAAFAFDTGVRLLDEQERRTNSLDSKAAVVLGAAGVIAGFVLRDDSIIRNAPLPVAIFASIGLVVSMLLALIAFATRNYSLAPRIESAVRLMAAEEDWLKWRFLGNLQEAHANNERRLKRKVRVLAGAHSSLVATIGTLGGYFCYLLITRA